MPFGVLRKAWTANWPNGPLLNRKKRIILGRISYTLDLKELASVDLLVEATIDHFYTKQELLRTADHLCRPPEVVFISTTSTLRVSDLARGITRNEQLVGLHFIPPRSRCVRRGISSTRLYIGRSC